MFWKNIYEKKLVKRRKEGYCKYCNCKLKKGESAIILNLTFGHELPINDFDIHFQGMMGIFHQNCVDQFIKQESEEGIEDIIK